MNLVNTYEKIFETVKKPIMEIESYALQEKMLKSILRKQN